jgi:hypothetical protein
MNLRDKAAEVFEDVCLWSGRRGWHQVHVGYSEWEGEQCKVYRSQKSPDIRAAACRVLCEVSGWAMRACMRNFK